MIGRTCHAVPIAVQLLHGKNLSSTLWELSDQRSHDRYRGNAPVSPDYKQNLPRRTEVPRRKL